MFSKIFIWLETNIRKPYLEGTYIDIYVATPMKDLYCQSRKIS